MIDAWLTDSRARNSTEVYGEDAFGRPVQPSIKAEFEAREAVKQFSTTVQDACLHIIDNGGWGAILVNELDNLEVREAS